MQFADKRLNFSILNPNNKSWKSSKIDSFLAVFQFFFQFSNLQVIDSFIPSYKKLKRPPSQIFPKFPELFSSIAAIKSRSQQTRPSVQYAKSSNATFVIKIPKHFSHFYIFMIFHFFLHIFLPTFFYEFLQDFYMNFD